MIHGKRGSADGERIHFLTEDRRDFLVDSHACVTNSRDSGTHSRRGRIRGRTTGKGPNIVRSQRIPSQVPDTGGQGGGVDGKRCQIGSRGEGRGEAIVGHRACDWCLPLKHGKCARGNRQRIYRLTKEHSNFPINGQGRAARWDRRTHGRRGRVRSRAGGKSPEISSRQLIPSQVFHSRGNHGGIGGLWCQSQGGRKGGRHAIIAHNAGNGRCPLFEGKIGVGDRQRIHLFTEGGRHHLVDGDIGGAIGGNCKTHGRGRGVTWDAEPVRGQDNVAAAAIGQGQQVNREHILRTHGKRGQGQPTHSVRGIRLDRRAINRQLEVGLGG